MFGLLKKSIYFIIKISDRSKCISLNNQPCITRATLFNSSPDNYRQGLNYYLFLPKMDRCNESCNTFNDFSNRIYVPSKTEDTNLHVFNIITKINESKTITKHVI